VGRCVSVCCKAKIGYIIQIIIIRDIAFIKKCDTPKTAPTDVKKQNLVTLTITRFKVVASPRIELGTHGFSVRRNST
ncbi:MAG: hypothetical protein KDH98_25505, partial [Calditrichaeota bacterium]|nr:hypothetical protein [Calditrichota bacterium]